MGLLLRFLVDTNMRFERFAQLRRLLPAVMVCGLILMLCAGCRLIGGNTTTRAADAIAGRQLTNQGVSAIEQGQWSRAEELLNRSMSISPEEADTYRYLAEVHWHAGRKADAIATLRKAVGLDPDNADFHTLLAGYYLDQQQLPEAWYHTNQSLAFANQSAEAWAIRARILNLRGRQDEALIDFHRALSCDSDNREIMYETAELYRRMNRPGQALAMLQNLAETYQPGNEPQNVQYGIGLAQLALERYEDSSRSLAAAAAAGPDSDELMFRRAQAMWGAGYRDEARRLALQAAIKYPEHTQIQALLARISETEPRIVRQSPLEQQTTLR